MLRQHNHSIGRGVQSNLLHRPVVRVVVPVHRRFFRFKAYDHIHPPPLSLNGFRLVVGDKNLSVVLLQQRHDPRDVNAALNILTVGLTGFARGGVGETESCHRAATSTDR